MIEAELSLQNKLANKFLNNISSKIPSQLQHSYYSNLNLAKKIA